MPLAARLNRLVSSPVRDVLARTAQSDVVSFAGGLPAPDSFPEISSLSVPPTALQYGPSEGDWPLREHVAALVTGRGLACTPEQVLILSGSQQGIDLVAKATVEVGSCVGVESPTYLAALQVFSLFGAEYRPFPVGGEPPACDLLYVNPTFQNPTGHCYSAAERERVRAAAARHGAVLFEDDPYHDLCFDPVDQRPIAAGFDGSWVYQGTFSKSLAPGLRLGYLVASPDLVMPLVQLKQAADLHTNRVAQHWVLSLLQASDADARLEALRARYRQRRDHFHAVLTEHFSDLATWDIPSGGLFFWLRLRTADCDLDGLLADALAEGVAFMPGIHFYSAGDENSSRKTLRLNFSNASEAEVGSGLVRLAVLLRRSLE
ncbi:MAG: PLP-dependent aminotransferase family protein [Pseudomonadota bacterium]